jgi:hypothetical protein
MPGGPRRDGQAKGSETCVAARLGMQVCDGHGFSTESVMSFRYRESIVATISGGTSQIQRNGIACGMGLRTYGGSRSPLPVRRRQLRFSLSRTSRGFLPGAGSSRRCRNASMRSRKS